MLQFPQRTRKIFQLHVGCILFSWDKTTTLSCEIVVYYSREKIICLWHTGSIILVLMSYSCPWWSLQSLVTGQTMWVVNWISQYCIMSVSCCTGHWYVGTWTSDQVGHDSIQVSVTNIAHFCNVANFVATQFLSPHYCGVQLESLPWSTLVYPFSFMQQKSPQIKF